MMLHKTTTTNERKGTSEDDIENFQDIERDIGILESQLAIAKAKLKAKEVLGNSVGKDAPSTLNGSHTTELCISAPISTPLQEHPPIKRNDLHLWLLLADSALPIGSFAFSSGLESYIMHRNLARNEHRSNTPYPANGAVAVAPAKPTASAELERFLTLSLRSTASAVVPYIRAAFLDPQAACELDDQFDASTTCAVARRASVSQGKALLTVWEKSLCRSGGNNSEDCCGARAAVDSYRAAVRREKGEAFGHFSVAWGAVCRAAGLGTFTLSQAAAESQSLRDEEVVDQVLFVFLFNHVKAVLSAAVRQSLIGPYGAQTILAGSKLKASLWRAVKAGKNVKVQDAGQTVPTIDMYQGRHEILYSRVFNS